jgi:hypothetical protein
MKKRFEKWSFCQSAFRWSEDDPDLDWHHAVETRANSRLIAMHCADVIGRDGGNYAHTTFFVLEGNSFRKIADLTGERVF